MNIYTIDDVRLLAKIYEEYNTAIAGLTEEEKNRFGTAAFSYISLMEIIIKEKESPEASLLELIGAYDMVAHPPEGWEPINHFLFEAPLSDMPKHINDSGGEEWKKKVARWRLQIGK